MSAMLDAHRIRARRAILLKHCTLSVLIAGQRARDELKSMLKQQLLLQQHQQSKLADDNDKQAKQQ